MRTKSKYQILLDVQERDTEIQAIKLEIEKLPEKYRLEELGQRLKDARDKLGVRNENIDEFQREQHKLEGELELLEGKIKKEEGKLFSGTIMNPKELAGIQQEVISLKKKRDEQETEFLERLEEVEVFDNELEESRKEETEVLKAEEEARGRYYEEKAELEKKITELERARDKLKENIEPPVISLYEELLEQKGGLAAVKIERNVCGGCHLEISSVDMDYIRHSDELYRCRFCRRIMVK